MLTRSPCCSLGTTNAPMLSRSRDLLEVSNCCSSSLRRSIFIQLLSFFSFAPKHALRQRICEPGILPPFVAPTDTQLHAPCLSWPRFAYDPSPTTASPTHLGLVFWLHARTEGSQTCSCETSTSQLVAAGLPLFRRPAGGGHHAGVCSALRWHFEPWCWEARWRGLGSCQTREEMHEHRAHGTGVSSQACDACRGSWRRLQRGVLEVPMAL